MTFWGKRTIFPQLGKWTPTKLLFFTPFYNNLHTPPIPRLDK